MGKRKKEVEENGGGGNVKVSESGHRTLEALERRYGIPKTRSIERLLDWFDRLNPDLQGRLISREHTPREIEIVRVLLRELEADENRPLKSRDLRDQGARRD